MFEFLKRWKKPAIAQDAATQTENERDALHMLIELQRRMVHMAAMGDGLQNVAAGIGTERDKRMFTGYTAVQPIQYQQAEVYYRSNYVAGNIVDVRATDMVREWYDVAWDGSDEDANRQQQLADAEAEFDWQTKYLDAITWARLHGGSAIVFGIRGQDPETPLDVNTLGANCLEYVHVFDRWRLSAEDLMDKGEDISSPNFLQPRFYTLGGSSAETGVRVHWSRVITFHGRRLPYRSYLENGMWGDSVLLRVIEEIKDYSSVMAMLATMFFEANVDVMMVAGLASLLAQPKGEEKVNKRFNIAAAQKSANRLLMLDAGDRYEKKGNNFAGLGAIVSDFRIHLCAAAETPESKLFGVFPGGLSTTGEGADQNYRASIAQAQKLSLTPQVLRGYKILLRHRFGQEPKGFTIKPRSLYVETRMETADRELKNAQRDQIYMSGNGSGNAPIGAHTIAKELKEKGVYATLEDPEVAMVKTLEEEASEAERDEAKRQAEIVARAREMRGGKEGAPGEPEPKSAL